MADHRAVIAMKPGPSKTDRGCSSFLQFSMMSRSACLAARGGVAGRPCGQQPPAARHSRGARSAGPGARRLRAALRNARARHCIGDETNPRLLFFGGRQFLAVARVEPGQRSKLRFESPPQSAKCRRLLLGEFVFDQINECGIGLAVEHRSNSSLVRLSLTAIGHLSSANPERDARLPPPSVSAHMLAAAVVIGWQTRRREERQ